MSKSNEVTPDKWRRAAERARKVLAKANATRELGLKRPALTAAGGPQAAQFKNSRKT